MATNIGKLAVTLSTDTSRFTAGMSSAAGVVSRVQQAVGRATDTVRAWDAVTASTREFKLAGTETLDSFRTTLAVARGELRRFGRNKDVMVAVEIGREFVDEAWIRARQQFNSLAARSGLKVAASVVSGTTGDAAAWARRQQRRLTKPITVRVEMARRAIDGTIESITQRLNTLRRYRAIRIAIAAANGMKLPVAAAMATLGPLRRLAMRGLIVPVRVAHYGVTAGIAEARAALGGLSSFGRSVTSALTSGFGLVSLALAGLGGFGFGSLIKSSLEAIDANAKLADRLGMTTQSIAGLQYAGDLAGVSADALTGGLEKMLKSLGGVSDDGEDLTNAFTKLGLSANALANMPADQAFSQIAQKISDIKNPTERATAAMSIFGKSGQSLLPLLMSGADGIAAAQAEAEKLGLTMNRLDSAKVEAANDAMTRAQKVFTGAGNAIAVQLAPYIEVAATKFFEMATSGEGVGTRIVGAFRGVVGAIAYASDYLSLATAGFKLLQAAGTIGVFAVVKSIDVLGKGMVGLMNLLPGVNVQWTDFTGQLADGLLDEAGKLKDEAGDAFDNFTAGANSKAVNEWFDDVQSKADETAKDIAGKAAAGPQIKPFVDADAIGKVKDTLDGIRNDVTRVGMNDGQRKIADLTAGGATADQIGEAKELLGLQTRLEGLTKVDAHDPFGDFGKKTDDLRALAAQGKVTADQLNAIQGSAVLSLADNVKIGGDDALTEYASAMQQLQALYAAGKVTSEEFATIKASATTSLNETLQDQAKSLTDSLRTPLENYQSEIEKLNAMFDRGLIDKTTLDRATQKARDTMNGAGSEPPKGRHRHPRGIAGGHSLRVRFGPRPVEAQQPRGPRQGSTEGNGKADQEPRHDRPEHRRHRGRHHA